MDAVSWARMHTSSSSTSTTNSRGKTKGRRQRRSKRAGPGKRPGRSHAQGCKSQLEFIVNIILLIRRDVKRNLRPCSTFLWKNLLGPPRGDKPYGTVSWWCEGVILPAGAGGAPAGSAIRVGWHQGIAECSARRS